MMKCVKFMNMLDFNPRSKLKGIKNKFKSNTCSARSTYQITHMEVIKRSNRRFFQAHTFDVFFVQKFVQPTTIATKVKVCSKNDLVIKKSVL